MNRREFLAGAGTSALLLPSAAEALTSGQRTTLLGGASIPALFNHALDFFYKENSQYIILGVI